LQQAEGEALLGSGHRWTFGYDYSGPRVVVLIVVPPEVDAPVIAAARAHASVTRSVVGLALVGAAGVVALALVGAAGVAGLEPQAANMSRPSPTLRICMRCRIGGVFLLRA
jgi:hypothetical protein